MTSKRQPKLRTSLRVWATVWLVAFISATAFCAGDLLFSHSHHDEERAATPSDEPSHEHDAAPPGGSAGHSHGSNSSGHDSPDGDSCCATLKAVSHSSNSPVLPKLDFAKLTFLRLVLPSQDLNISAPENSPPRQARPSEWVFTPEVCLGPAFRSHAPPVLS